MGFCFAIITTFLLSFCLGASSAYAQMGNPEAELLFPYSADTVGTSVYWPDMSAAALVIQRKGGIMMVDPAKEKGDTSFPNISEVMSSVSCLMC